MKLIKDFYSKVYYDYNFKSVAYAKHVFDVTEESNQINLEFYKQLINSSLVQIDKYLEGSVDNFAKVYDQITKFIAENENEEIVKAQLELEKSKEYIEAQHLQSILNDYIKEKKFEDAIEFGEEILDIFETLSLKQLENIDGVITLLWTITTTLFVVGGMIGAFTSKYVLDKYGRKNGILFHYIFTINGSVLVFICKYINRPELMMISRLFYGIQGGMSCGLIPTYLSETSPPALRGATGVMHQLCLTIGILVAQTLGFRQLLGTDELWHVLLAIPLIPCVLGGVCLIFFFPETPRALLIDKKDEEAAREALIKLRNSSNISYEIEQIIDEAKENQTENASISIRELFTLSELRWPLITGLVLQLAQQLCGINAIFFYSESIFKSASIQNEFIQYCVFATGLINVICTIVCVPLIDRLGRKPLLVAPMIMIIIDFVALTFFLSSINKGITYSYLSIVCIIIFIMCFAVGLGIFKSNIFIKFKYY